MARPKIELDPKLVEDLARAQLTNVEIAMICGCEEKTITRRFGDSLKAWKQAGVGSVRRKLYTQAMAGSNSAIIFFLKNYGGMADVTREVKPLELDGVPIPAEFRANPQPNKPN